MVLFYHSYYGNHKDEFLVVLIFVPLKVYSVHRATKCRQLYIYIVSWNWRCVWCRHSNFASVTIIFKTTTLDVCEIKKIIVSIQNRAGPRHVFAPGQADNVAPPHSHILSTFFCLGEDWRKFFQGACSNWG